MKRLPNGGRNRFLSRKSSGKMFRNGLNTHRPPRKALDEDGVAPRAVEVEDAVLLQLAVEEKVVVVEVAEKVLALQAEVVVPHPKLQPEKLPHPHQRLRRW